MRNLITKLKQFFCIHDHKITSRIEISNNEVYKTYECGKCNVRVTREEKERG